MSFCSVPFIILCKDAGHCTKVFYWLQVVPVRVRMVRKACNRLNARARPKGLMLIKTQEIQTQEPVSHMLPLIWQTPGGTL